jgi:hypothetical protein
MRPSTDPRRFRSCALRLQTGQTKEGGVASGPWHEALNFSPGASQRPRAQRLQRLVAGSPVGPGHVETRMKDGALQGIAHLLIVWSGYRRR